MKQQSNKELSKMEDNQRIIPVELAELPGRFDDDWPSTYWKDSSGAIQGVAFSIYKKPIPMPRPSATITHGGGIRVYSPKKTKGGPFSEEVKRLVLVTTEKLLPDLPLFKDGDTGLNVSITYRIRRPNCHYRGGNRLNGVVKAGMHLRRVTGGDIDNLIKYTLDSLNTVVYADDKMITSISAKKLWCEDPNSEGSTTVEVKKITY
jgi:Holliday junction resolvase RusA-like endonuclease